MEHRYVCRECEEPCVLTICLKADAMPDECPWCPGISNWVDLEKSEQAGRSETINVNIQKVAGHRIYGQYLRVEIKP